MCEIPIFFWECKGRAANHTHQIVGKEFSTILYLFHQLPYHIYSFDFHRLKESITYLFLSNQQIKNPGLLQTGICMRNKPNYHYALTFPFIFAITSSAASPLTPFLQRGEQESHYALTFPFTFAITSSAASPLTPLQQRGEQKSHYALTFPFTFAITSSAILFGAGL
jgi:hypothetical protein